MLVFLLGELSPSSAGKLLKSLKCVCVCVSHISHVRLCDSMDCSPPDSSIHGILQARILEWVAISFSRGSSQPRDQTWVSALQADALPSEPPGKPPQMPVSLLGLIQISLRWDVFLIFEPFI